MWQVSGVKLREAMLNAGCGPTELSARAGVNKKRVAELRAGGGWSMDGTVYKLARALGVKPREILEEELDGTTA